MIQIKPTKRTVVLRNPLIPTKIPVTMTKAILSLKSESKIQPLTGRSIIQSTKSKSLNLNSTQSKTMTKIKLFEILIGAAVSITVSTLSNLSSLMNFYDKYLDRTSYAETVTECPSVKPVNNKVTKPIQQVPTFDSSDPDNWVGYGCANNYTQVQDVQKLLNHKLNSGLVCDGKFGLETYKAIVKFQSNVNGLSQDGIVGPNTWKWLLDSNSGI